MGLRLYLAGTEGLIGQAMQVALEAGIDHTSMQTEHRGSLARRMQCVHCKGITENVTTQPVDLRALRPAASGARPLFPAARGLPGRLHQCRGARQRFLRSEEVFR